MPKKNISSFRGTGWDLYSAQQTSDGGYVLVESRFEPRQQNGAHAGEGTVGWLNSTQTGTANGTRLEELGPTFGLAVQSADGGFLWAEDQTQVHRNRTKWGRALWIVKLRPNGEMDWGEFDGSLPP